VDDLSRAFLESALLFVRLPDLHGAAIPDRCPLCLAPIADSQDFREQVASGGGDPRYVVYWCGSAYPKIQDGDAIWLDMHPDACVHDHNLHPLAFLAVFRYYFRWRLSTVGLADMVGLEPPALVKWHSDYRGGQTPVPISPPGLRGFSWSAFPFELWFGQVKDVPPPECPACGETQVYVDYMHRPHSATPYAVRIDYACGASLFSESVFYGRWDEDPPVWKGSGSCRQPRFAAVLSAKNYFALDPSGNAAQEREQLLAAWSQGPRR
jgi:hypothetical protein